jgi:hypothetical protein
LTIKPASIQGRIDVLIDDGEGRRTYTEGKVFDNANRNKGYIRKGFGQLLTYMDHYNTAAAYLVIYNTCKERLSIVGDENVLTIPVIRHAGKAVFVLVIDVSQQGPASERRVKHINITKDDLVKSET